jgi:methionyl-tRNA formyltransferase
MFMGTPEFAVPSLELLIQKGLSIVAVVTQPDRPKGRGRKNEPPPIKIIAEKYGVPVHQPERVRDESFLSIFRQIAPDMVILVAFGQILPKEIIDYPRLGCINLHPSLLPKYRGAAPINWALIRGETMTGVSIIEMNEKVDAGKILLQKEVPIEPQEIFGELHDRLSHLGAQVLLKAVWGVFDGSVSRQSQDEAKATFAPRFKKEDARIAWDRDVADIVNCIRGLSPVPAAYSCIDGRQLKIFVASGEEMPVSEPAGTILPGKEQGLPVAARNGYVYLREVQIEGKKRMPARDFLRGQAVIGKKFD